MLFRSVASCGGYSSLMVCVVVCCLLLFAPAAGLMVCACCLAWIGVRVCVSVRYCIFCTGSGVIMADYLWVCGTESTVRSCWNGLVFGCWARLHVY